MATNVEYNVHGRELTKTGICSVSGKRYESTVTVDQFIAWKKGEKIQRAMRDLDNEQREFWITGLTPGEWEEMFPPEKDDE